VIFRFGATMELGRSDAAHFGFGCSTCPGRRCGC
jgi:hypothetical protein